VKRMLEAPAETSTSEQPKQKPFESPSSHKTRKKAAKPH
jgi:hypothetical protein